jgi:membrane-bound lytic murein transglycosylase
MKNTFSAVLIAFVLLLVASSSAAQATMNWKIHDLNRPVPPVIDPGTPTTPDTPGHPPSDAVVLFDGKDVSQWVDKDGKSARWKVENGYMEVLPRSGNISTREAFGDCQLHVEFAEPLPASGESQERGNSGVFLMGLYEMQVLDSYQNKTYADGQAAAVYGQYPPLVNASRPPGQWQTYDIIFHGPRFAKDGKLVHPARVAILHNGVLVQDNVELTGPTAHGERPPYKAHPEKLALALQDHGNLVRYRNIWIRELKEGQ